MPCIVEAEQPPVHREEALERWKNAQKRFQSALKKCRGLKATLEGLRGELEKLPVVAKAEKEAEDKHAAAKQTNDGLETMLEISKQHEQSKQAINQPKNIPLTVYTLQVILCP